MTEPKLSGEYCVAIHNVVTWFGLPQQERFVTIGFTDTLAEAEEWRDLFVGVRNPELIFVGSRKEFEDILSVWKSEGRVNIKVYDRALNKTYDYPKEGYSVLEAKDTDKTK